MRSGGLVVSEEMPEILHYSLLRLPNYQSKHTLYPFFLTKIVVLKGVI